MEILLSEILHEQNEAGRENCRTGNSFRSFLSGMSTIRGTSTHDLQKTYTVLKET